MTAAPNARVVAALGTAQTLAWASSYYLPAMLAVPIARDLGVTVPTVFAAFSVALLVSALLGPAAGRAIDHWGGRPVLMATNLVFALGLAGLGLAQHAVGLFLAWAVLGVGMASGLYEAAFAALVRLYGRGSRNAITGITLIAGFASTVGWRSRRCSKRSSAGAPPASRGPRCTSCSDCRSMPRCRAWRRSRGAAHCRRRPGRPHRRRGPRRNRRR